MVEDEGAKLFIKKLILKARINEERINNIKFLNNINSVIFDLIINSDL